MCYNYAEKMCITFFSVQKLKTCEFKFRRFAIRKSFQNSELHGLSTNSQGLLLLLLNLYKFNI